MGPESTFEKIRQKFFRVFAAGKRIVGKAGNEVCAEARGIEDDFRVIFICNHDECSELLKLRKILKLQCF